MTALARGSELVRRLGFETENDVKPFFRNPVCYLRKTIHPDSERTKNSMPAVGGAAAPPCHMGSSASVQQMRRKTRRT